MWTCVLTKLLTIPKVLGPPEITFYQENTPAFSFPTKQRPYCGNVAALPTIPTPSAPSPQVLSQLSAAQPHPHLGMEGWSPRVLQHSGPWSGPQEAWVWARCR